MSIELDHVFWMMPKADVPAAAQAFETFGLRESYRRRHPGQGTANICYCFGNAFLEILWLEDEAEARSPEIARTLLAERATGTANPFGIAWRGDAGIAMWDFKPPYLPDGLSIAVAEACDDPQLPLMFSFPGSKPPGEMDPERHNGMQSHAGLDLLEIAALDGIDQPAMQEIAAAMTPPFEIGPAVHLCFDGPAGRQTLSLPICSG